MFSVHLRFVIEENSVTETTWLTIVANSFSKSSLYKMFSESRRKRNAGVFKVLRFEPGAFSESSVFACVDSRPTVGRQ